MKKIFFYILISLMVSYPVSAQRLDRSINTSAEKTKVVFQKESKIIKPSQPEKIEDLQDENEQSESEQTEEESAPPTTITPEQKAEINVQANRQTKGIVRVQTPRQRRSFIDALQMLDKKAARQEAMSEGKNEKEIEKAAEKVKKPDVNPLDDDELEKYLFKKVDVNERIKTTDE